MTDEMKSAPVGVEGREAAEARECPHRTRCDCLAACKYGMAGDGSLAAQQGGHR